MSTPNDLLNDAIDDAKHNRAIEKIKLANEYTAADNIIRYLTNPEDDSIKLTDTEKKKYDILKEIHALRMRYARKSDILNIIKKTSGLKESQCYKLIQDCEYVFGSMSGVNKAYERQFLLEASRKNIELAMNSRKSEVISKALREHYVLCGLSEINVEMPDFSALEPNNYIISLPEGQQKLLMELVARGGFINTTDLIPHQNVIFDTTAKDVTNGE